MLGQALWHMDGSPWQTLMKGKTNNILYYQISFHYNERDGTSNHRHLDCLLNRLFRRRSKKLSKLCVTGLYEGIHRWFPSQRASKAENVSFWWRRHVVFKLPHVLSLRVSFTCRTSRYFHPKLNKQRVLMHGHQGWNVRHGLCHIYMIYVYKWVV